MSIKPLALVFFVAFAAAREKRPPSKTIGCGIDAPVAFEILATDQFAVLRARPEGFAIARLKKGALEELASSAGTPRAMAYDSRRNQLFVLADDAVKILRVRKKELRDGPAPAAPVAPALAFSLMNRRLYFVAGTELRAYDPVAKKEEVVANLASAEKIGAASITALGVSSDGQRLYWAGAAKADPARAVAGIYSLKNKRDETSADLPFKGAPIGLNVYRNAIVYFGGAPGELEARAAASLRKVGVSYDEVRGLPTRAAQLDGSLLFYLEDAATGACVKSLGLDFAETRP